MKRVIMPINNKEKYDGEILIKEATPVCFTKSGYLAFLCKKYDDSCFFIHCRYSFDPLHENDEKELFEGCSELYFSSDNVFKFSNYCVICEFIKSVDNYMADLDLYFDYISGCVVHLHMYGKKVDGDGKFADHDNNIFKLSFAKNLLPIFAGTDTYIKSWGTDSNLLQFTLMKKYTNTGDIKNNILHNTDNSNISIYKIAKSKTKRRYFVWFKINLHTIYNPSIIFKSNVIFLIDLDGIKIKNSKCVNKEELENEYLNMDITNERLFICNNSFDTDLLNNELNCSNVTVLECKERKLLADNYEYTTILLDSSIITDLSTLMKHF